MNQKQSSEESKDEALDEKTNQKWKDAAYKSFFSFPEMVFYPFKSLEIKKTKIRLKGDHYSELRLLLSQWIRCLITNGYKDT